MGYLKVSILLLVILSMHIVKNVLVRTRTHDTVSHSIPIYWINMDKSVDRRVRMHQHLQGHEHVRIRAVDAYEAREKVSTSQISHIGVTFYTMTNETITYKKRLAHSYSYKELACTLSHVKAIQQAYDDGHEMAIILEDDVVFLPRFWPLIKYLIDSAPADWEILQLYTTHFRAMVHACHLKDPWVHWKSYFWGAQGYVIRRSGMRKILSQTSFDNRVVVADEFVYHHARAYMSTYPEIAITGSPSNIQTSNDRSTVKYAQKLRHKLLYDCNFPTLEPVKTSKKLVVITSVSTPQDLKHMKQDKAYLEKWHDGPVEWVIEGPNGYKDIDGDYVLVKHIGIRLVGFPWQTFFESAQSATVSGALRAHQQHHLIVTRESTDTVFEAFHWTSGTGKVTDENGHGSFTKDSPIPVDMVEKSFALLNGSFFRDFFATPRASRYDFEWCGVASNWSSQRPCQLIPVVIDQDYREIVYDEPVPSSKAAEYSRPFRESFMTRFGRKYRELGLNDKSACLSFHDDKCNI